MLTFKAETNALGKEILWVIVLTSTKIVSFSLMVELNASQVNNHSLGFLAEKQINKNKNNLQLTSICLIIFFSRSEGTSVCPFVPSFAAILQ